MSLQNGQNDVCFVVMPFGIKPANDGSARTFDFDKVYRVIIQKAVKDAGLSFVRADEQVGSQMIHLDMFKSLRDTAIVLADLSTTNPNVFYELGIRHVMSPKGTVLMCRQGTELPFDIKLSRVIFYKYDGQDLDWEEAERVKLELKAALEEAQRGRLDSPVHALLEGVLPKHASASTAATQALPKGSTGEHRTEDYQKLIAGYWKKEPGLGLNELLEKYGESQFGRRAIGYYCLAHDPLPTEASRVASDLYDYEQYDVATDIYKRLEQSRELGIREMLRYGSALSEEKSTKEAAELGLKYTVEARERAESTLKSGKAGPKDYEDAFHACNNCSGLRLWISSWTQSSETLQKAIEDMEKALSYKDQALQGNTKFPLGRLAQAHLKLLLMLRQRDKPKDQKYMRDDSEGHLSEILRLRPEKDSDQVGVSYLEWYQAIAWADMGDEKEAYDLTIRRVAEDATVANRFPEIGRRQYSQLRRFIENNSRLLRNPILIGRLSQALQLRR